MAINYGKHTADFTPKSMPVRDGNAAVIDMNFNGLNGVIRSHTDRIASIYSSLESLAVAIASAGGGGATGANPSATAGLAAVDGAAATFMRSDAAPAISQAITPTWSALHTFTLAPKVTAFAGVGDRMVYANSLGQLGVQAIPGTTPGDLVLKPTSTAPSGYTYTGQIYDRIFPWTSAVLSTFATMDGAWASYSGFCYFACGNNGAAVNSNFRKINMADMTIATIASPSAGSQFAAMASDTAGKLFLTGGSSFAGTATNSLDVFTIGAGTWASSPSVMPGVRHKHCMVYYSGKMYVFGGADNSPAFVTTTYILDLAGGTWTTGAAMPAGRINARAAVIGGKVYVMGGNSTLATVSPSNSCYCYDIAGNSWTTKATMPLALTQALVIESGTVIFHIGGAINASGVFKSVRNCYIYDTLSDLWYNGPSLNLPRAGAFLGVNGQDVFICHGASDGTFPTRVATSEHCILPQVPAYLMSKN